jgi:Mn-dependent DtxR family transcriptional regulator
MLERLLAIVQQGGLQTTESLAHQLGVTPGLVEAMLVELERRGYVVQVGTCGRACTGCDLAATCGQAGVQRVWTVRRAHEKA